jgi:hypothetical protein
MDISAFFVKKRPWNHANKLLKKPAMEMRGGTEVTSVHVTLALRDAI